MAADWKPGDLALCVDETDYDGTKLPVSRGSVYTVADVFDGLDAYSGCPGVLGLELVELPPTPKEQDGFDARCFRKIHPHTPDAEDEETIRLLTGKPIHLPA